MKLRHKFTLIGASIVMAMALVILLIASYNGVYREKIKAKKTQDEATMLLYHNITEILEEKKRIINYLGEHLSHEIEQHNIEFIEELLHKSRSNLKSFTNFSYYSIEGVKKVDLNRIGINQKYRESFLTSFYNNIKSDYAFTNSFDTGEKVLLFGQTITDRQKKIRGVLTAELPTSEINQMISKSFDSSILKNWDIELLRSDGAIIYSNIRVDDRDNPLLEYIKLNLANNQTLNHLEDQEYLWTFAKNVHEDKNQATNQLYFVIKVEKYFVYQEIYKELKTYLGVFIIFLIFTSFIIYHGASKITAPIEEAYLAINDFGSGNFDNVKKLKESDDEFGAIVKALKDSASKIEFLISDQANKFRMASLGKMAGNIAHEINSPLHLITNHCKLLLRNLENQKENPNQITLEKVEKSTLAIHETTRRIALIISGLKSLSREGRLDPFEKVPAQKIITDTMNLCKESLQNKGVQIKVTIPDEEILVECRSVQLSQVLLNLLNNASDAIDKSSEKWIHIKVYQNHENLFIKVINSGEKIKADIAKLIFQPYFTTKEVGKGTGLGLSISQAILKDHKGDLYIDLNEEFTAFIFKVPLYNVTKISKAS